METETVRQLHGAKDLARDVVDVAVQKIGNVHLAIARRPYAMLARFPVVAPVSKQVEQLQTEITVGVYGAIRVVNRLVATAARRQS
ncbi:MAG: hypothetical protein IPK16_04075 [Anaerolineales bacterium]|nr:hypothetical protein [Anaerolineales bacterium]